MKKSSFRPVGVSFLIAMTFIIAMIRTEVKANSPRQVHVSAYNSHVNHENNWGLFGIIGVIALAGLTKRNEVSKN